MRWAGRILSGLWIVTAGYIWTVWQGGFDSVNRNLCDLWTDTFGPLSSCQFNKGILWLWGIGAFAVAVFLIFDFVRMFRKRGTRRKRRDVEDIKISTAIDYIVNDSIANLEKPSRPEALGRHPAGTTVTVRGVEHQDARRQLSKKINCGELKSLGLRQIDTHIPNHFEHSLREIPASYWNEMELDFQSCLYYKGPYSQTMKIPGKPETFHWADIHVPKAKVEELWPEKSIISRIWARIMRKPRISHAKTIRYDR